MTKKYDNSGALFKNEKKEKDTHPDYTGSITVEGADYWLCAWITDGALGNYLSLSVKKKDNEPKSRNNDLDSDIPF